MRSQNSYPQAAPTPPLEWVFNSPTPFKKSTVPFIPKLFFLEAIASTTSSHTIQILRNHSRVYRIQITPTVIVQLCLPSPEDPSQSVIFITHNLCLKPFFIECTLSRCRPASCILYVVWGRKRELSYDCWTTGAGNRVIRARRLEVGGLGGGDGGPFKIAMFVI